MTQKCWPDHLIGPGDRSCLIVILITIHLERAGGGRGNKRVNVLWLIDSFTRFLQGIVLKNKEAETVVAAMNSTWNWRFGFPSVGFWADNGPEFKNHEIEEYVTLDVSGGLWLA